MNKAEEFRKFNEESQYVIVPYQNLREYLKSHTKTKGLVNEFLNSNPAPDAIYFSFIDLDTLDFNGIYSAYKRIIHNHHEKYVSYCYVYRLCI